MFSEGVCVCSLSYLACNVHVPYCHLWPALLYSIFPHYVINSMVLKKVIKYKMWVLVFSRLLSDTFVTLRRNEQDVIKQWYWSSL